MKGLPRRIRTTSKPRNQDEEKLLKSIGRKIHKDLYDLDKPVEWLAWESGVARSTIQRIFDADRNLGLLTLDRVAKGLGYAGVIEFLGSI
ncbi:MAG: hypothetical protein HYV97_20090 [Bdellovibrio sp.]|nr:hypothetical protein [Bdellovibrio sp.]